jgi:hypothetical protein
MIFIGRNKRLDKAKSASESDCVAGWGQHETYSNIIDEVTIGSVSECWISVGSV